MKTKTSELQGAELVKWVARAHPDWDVIIGDNGKPNFMHGGTINNYFDPLTNKAQAFELIKKFSISLNYLSDKNWEATIAFIETGNGKTPSEAICRCVVASVFGDYVEEDES